MQHNLDGIDHGIINFLQQYEISFIAKETKDFLEELTYDGFLETDEVDLRSFGFSAEVSLSMAAHLNKIAKEKKANKRISQLEIEIELLRKELRGIYDEPGAVGGPTSKAIALNDEDKLITQFQNNLAIGRDDEPGAFGGLTSKSIALNDAKKPIKKPKSKFKKPPKVKVNYDKPNIIPNDTLTSGIRRDNCRGGNVTDKASNDGQINLRYRTVIGSLSLPAGARYEMKAKSQIQTDG